MRWVATLRPPTAVSHYWRPLMPANADRATITHVLDWAARYSACSVAVGLKVKPGARRQITEPWPELRHQDLPLEAAAAVWPRKTWDLLASLPYRYPNHPVYQTNSCALAHVLQRPDTHRIRDTPTCCANHCLTNQRERCAATTHPPVTAENIHSHLTWLGMPAIPAIDFDAQQRTATAQGALSLRDRNNVSQRFVITVRAPRAGDERYWSGRLQGSGPLVIDS